MFENLHVAIVDDEVLICETIFDYLSEMAIGQISLVHSEAKAKELFETRLPDLVLLDIRLSIGKEGLELGKLLNEVYKIPFVYITAQSDYQMVDNILRTKPAGYLTKPLDKAQFIVTLHPILQTILLSKSMLAQDEIIFIQASGNYWEVVSTNGKKLMRKTLEELVPDPQFSELVRIHRSYLVNLSKVQRYNGGYVFLKGDIELPVARQYQSQLRQLLSQPR